MNACLQEVAFLNPRFPASLQPESLISFVPMAVVSAEEARITAAIEKSYSEVAKGYTYFENGDVLLAKITPCFENGKIAQAVIPRQFGFGSTEFHVIRPKPDRLDGRYLHHFLRQPKIRLDGEERMTGSGGQRRVPATFLSQLIIPTPPLAEQRRIASILDQAAALRAKRREALAQLDNLTQSIFIEMFGDPVTNSMGWKTESLDGVANFFAGNSLPEGIPFTGQQDGFFLMKVSDMNLAGNEKTIESCKHWSSVPGSRSGTCPAKSIVIPKRGGAIGTNKKRITSRETILDPNLMAISPKLAILDLEYLFQWFLWFDLSSIASGSSVPQLNKQDLAPLKIQVPPFSIQKTFATRLEAIEAVKLHNSASLAELDTLFASLQHRAFQGEL